MSDDWPKVCLSACIDWSHLSKLTATDTEIVAGTAGTPGEPSGLSEEPNQIESTPICRKIT